MASKAAENIPIKASSTAASKQQPMPMKRSRSDPEDKENLQMPAAKKQRVVAFVSPSKILPVAAKTKIRGRAGKAIGKRQPKPCIKSPRTSIGETRANEANTHWHIEGHLESHKRLAR